jgi:BrxA
MAIVCSDMISSDLIVKGALILETYTAFGQWDLRKSRAENLIRLRQNNTVGAKTASWLEKIAKALRRRFDPEGRDRPLVELAQRGCDLEIWKPLLLWHMTRDEFLLRDFLSNWLHSKYREATNRLRSADVLPYLTRIRPSWTDSTLNRIACGLLRMGADFGLLRGRAVREFNAYHLPEQSFIYLLHAMRDELHNAGKVIESPDWHMFLMTRQDVEDELYRLHQFRRLHFESAGSLAQLELPYASLAEYTRSMVNERLA